MSGWMVREKRDQRMGGVWYLYKTSPQERWIMIVVILNISKEDRDYATKILASAQTWGWQ